MEPMYYIGLDVHKRKITYCWKDGSGKVFAEGLLSATCLDLDLWMKTLPQPWRAAMEATMFTGWITSVGSISEVPMTTLQIAGGRAPLAGGAYLRLLPCWYTQWAIRFLNTSELRPACVYLHP